MLRSGHELVDMFVGLLLRPLLQEHPSINWGRVVLGTVLLGGSACSSSGAPDSEFHRETASEASSGEQAPHPSAAATGSVTGSGGTTSFALDGPYAGDVTIVDSTVNFVHEEVVLSENGTLFNDGGREVTTTTYPVKVIENDLVRVTVLPEYGGRLLSLIYKPTNHEMLYQNSVGTAFGVGNDIFYYDWLMVYGGIFPTFPEPEHGKTWFLPWEYEEVSVSPDRVVISMSFTDDIEPGSGTPPDWPESNFSNGRTDLKVTASVSVQRGSSAVGFDVSVENTRDAPVDYEYWTCTTLTPGSSPGATFSPLNTEMIVPVERVFTPFYRNWMNDVQAPLVDTPRGGGSAIYPWDNFAHLSEWESPGILYAEPRMEEDYWGVINHDNEVGIFRVADAEETPGLKIWTWGADSVSVNPDEPNDARPYIELWAGHSPEFFESTTINPREVREWDETYLPTIGLAKITDVNESAAVHLTVDNGELSARIFSALPSVETQVTMFALNGAENAILQESWAPDPIQASTFTAPIPEGSSEVGVRLSADGQVFFETRAPVP